MSNRGLPTFALWLILGAVVVALLAVFLWPSGGPNSPAAQPSPTTSGAGINGTIPQVSSTEVPRPDATADSTTPDASTQDAGGAATSYTPSSARVIPGVTPNPRVSPGDVLTTDVRTICTPGYTKTVRNVPQALKQQIYREYGILSRQPGEYEIDHIISLELGGSNSVRNLFPQSYKLHPLNAHVKDRLEDHLHALVCAGKLPIQVAQQAIARDWIGAYKKYLGPLPTN